MRHCDKCGHEREEEYEDKLGPDDTVGICAFCEGEILKKDLIYCNVCNWWYHFWCIRQHFEKKDYAIDDFAPMCETPEMYSYTNPQTKERIEVSRPSNWKPDDKISYCEWVEWCNKWTDTGYGI